MAEKVGPAPDESERAEPGGVQDLQHLELGIDRFGAFEVEHGGKRTSPGSSPGPNDGDGLTTAALPRVALDP